MNELKKYIKEILNIDIAPIPINPIGLATLPFYLLERYEFYEAAIQGRPIILSKLLEEDEISIVQLVRHQDLLERVAGKKIIFVFNSLPAIMRKRLIEKKVNFIVPGKQLYIPDLLMDLRETFGRQGSQKAASKLIPTAQFLLLFHILHRKSTIERFSFKELAGKLGYTPMAIGNAAENLTKHQLISVEGTKEKRIHFRLSRFELWNSIERQDLWINPVVKRIFVDKRPDPAALKCNASALPEYTDMNPGRQEYYAIEKTSFYALQRNNALHNTNEYDGKYCLELWKYNPLRLVDEMHTNENVVDPLSLYLSLKDEQDERVEMALTQIIGKYIW